MIPFCKDFASSLSFPLQVDLHIAVQSNDHIAREAVLQFRETISACASARVSFSSRLDELNKLGVFLDLLLTKKVFSFVSLGKKKNIPFSLFYDILRLLGLYWYNFLYL